MLYPLSYESVRRVRMDATSPILPCPGESGNQEDGDDRDGGHEGYDDGHDDQRSCPTSPSALGCCRLLLGDLLGAPGGVAGAHAPIAARR